MDNLKCLSAHVCDNLNKEDAIASIDLIDPYETLRKKLLKSMKIAKKFKEELKLANLEKEELVVRLDNSNKKNEILINQISFQDEKMNRLEEELVESKAKIENLTSTKPVVDVYLAIPIDIFVFYIPGCGHSAEGRLVGGFIDLILALENAVHLI